MSTFHPGHDALHGFTVVVFLSPEGAIAGRWDCVRNETAELHDACGDPAAVGDAVRAFLEVLKRDGPRPATKNMSIPLARIRTVRPFGDWLRSGAPEAG